MNWGEVVVHPSPRSLRIGRLRISFYRPWLWGRALGRPAWLKRQYKNCVEYAVPGITIYVMEAA